MRRQATILLLGLELLSGLRAQDRDPPEGLPGAYAVERISSGAIRLNLPASAPAKNSGGVFAGDPAVAQDPFGNIFVASRDADGAIWVNTFGAQIQDWGSWLYAGGTMQGTPAIVAAANGRVYIAARDRSNRYWIANYSPGVGAVQWTPVGGIFSNGPVMTTSPDGSVYIAGKDQWGALWSGKYTQEKGFETWILGPGPVKGEPSITTGADGAVYVAFRNELNRLAIARLENEKWNGLFPFWDSVEVGADPQAVELAGKIYVTAQDQSGRLCYGLFQEGIGNGWQAWACTEGTIRRRFAAVVADRVRVYGVDAANQLWQFQVFGSSWVWLGPAPFELQ
jgi:hypothetical protein